MTGYELTLLGRALLNAADDEKDEPVTTLPEFLLARIAEDEQWAKHAQTPVPDADGITYRWDPSTPRRPDGLRWGPTRVLAECEAKRAVVNSLATYRKVGESQTEVALKLVSQGMAAGLEAMLPYLAWPYADHPDWREEWRP